MPTGGQGAARRRLSPLRAFAFALLTPVLLLSGLEGALRLLEGPDGARSVDATSPVNFQQVPRPLFEEGTDGYSVFPQLVIDAAGLSIPRSREADELRVLLLGGSAAAGWNLPWTQNIAGAGERILDGALPDRRVRFYNLSRSGWASAQVLELFEGVVDRLRPDVVVVVSGNNEYLDIANAIALTGGQTRRVLRARALRSRSAIARAVPMPRDLVAQTPADGEVMPSPLYREIDEPELMGAYVGERLERNIVRIVRRAQEAGAAVVVGTIGVNDRFERWIDPLGMLPQEIHEHPVTADYLLARHYGPAEAGLAALEAAEEPRFGAGLAVLRGDLLLHDGRASAAASALTPWAWLLDEDPSATAEQRLTMAWAGRLRDPEGAPERARRALVEHPLPDSGKGDCHDGQLLYLSGAWEEARAAFAACRLDAWLYRAGLEANPSIQRAARRTGATLVDIDAAVRSVAEQGITGERQFWDYCHYTPEASLVAAHAVAAGVLRAIGRSEAIPSPQEASADFAARWQGRRVDPPELEHWVGVDHRPVGVFRMLPDRGEAPRGLGALGALYAGNRLAASVSPGRQELADEARAEWAKAAAMDPSLADVAAGNEQWLRWMLGERDRPAIRTALWEPDEGAVFADPSTSTSVGESAGGEAPVDQDP